MGQHAPTYGHTHTHTLSLTLSFSLSHPHTHTSHTLFSSGDTQQHRVIVYRSIAVITFTGDEHGSHALRCEHKALSVYPSAADFTEGATTTTTASRFYQPDSRGNKKKKKKKKESIQYLLMKRIKALRSRQLLSRPLRLS